MGETVLVVEKLKIESNPFDAGYGGRVGRALQKAFGEVVRHVGIETPLVVVSGSAGTGKTLLAKMAKRACADMGLSVLRVGRADFVNIAAGERSDVLLIDEADSMPEATLHRLLFDGNKRAATTTTVLFCLPASVRRFSTATNAVVVELTPLSQPETRLYLEERAAQAGFSDLFAPSAFDLVVEASNGVPRMLWSIAGLAYFNAASAGASQISRQHVADAVASQRTLPDMAKAAAPAAPAVKLVAETQSANPAASAAANPARISENIAAFPSVTKREANRRDDSSKAPMPQTPRPEAKESPAPSTSPTAAPTISTIIRRLPPIGEPISEPSTPAATVVAPPKAQNRELRIDSQKVADKPPVQIERSEATPVRLQVPSDFVATQAARVPEKLAPAMPISETPATPKPETVAVVQPIAKTQSEPLAFARARAGMEPNTARRRSMGASSVVAVTVALAAAVALAIHVYSMNEKGAVATATDVKNGAAVVNPVATSVNPQPSAGSPIVGSKGANARGQVADKNGVAKKTASAPNSSKPATRGERARRTAAAPVPPSATPPEAPPISTAVAAPPVNDVVATAPVQAKIVHDTGNSLRPVETAPVAASKTIEQQAEPVRTAQEQPAQAPAVAIPEVDAKEAARRAYDEAIREATAKAELNRANGTVRADNARAKVQAFKNTFFLGPR